MFMHKSKKGFTIVELVIVIAGIAILAAVLIPTFSNLVKKANMSAFLQEVKAVHAGFQGDLLRHPGGDQKVLALGLGKMKAMLRQQRLHHMDITYIDHSYLREWAKNAALFPLS